MVQFEQSGRGRQLHTQGGGSQAVVGRRMGCSWVGSLNAGAVRGHKIVFDWVVSVLHWEACGPHVSSVRALGREQALALALTCHLGAVCLLCSPVSLL